MFMELAQSKLSLPSNAAGTMLAVCSHSVSQLHSWVKLSRAILLTVPKPVQLRSMKANISAQYSHPLKTSRPKPLKITETLIKNHAALSKIQLPFCFPVVQDENKKLLICQNSFSHLLCRKNSAASAKLNKRSKKPLSSMSILGHKTSKTAQCFTLKLKWKILQSILLVRWVFALMQSITLHTPSTRQ